jgi:hypothetical protein
MENITSNPEPYQSTPPPGDPWQSSSSPKETMQQQADQAAATAREVKEAATEKASAAYEQAKSGAADLARQASEYIQQATQSQKGVLASKVDEYRDAARAASEKLQTEQHGPIAERVDRIAGQLDRLSGYLRETEPQQLLGDVEDFARRRPEVVLGTMFVAGLAAARFLKASKRRVPRGPDVPRYAGNMPSRPSSPIGVTYPPVTATGHSDPSAHAPIAAQPLTASPVAGINPGNTI